jgi:hypothetical protein
MLILEACLSLKRCTAASFIPNVTNHAHMVVAANRWTGSQKASLNRQEMLHGS